MTYAEATTYIAGLQRRGWRLGLDRMHEFLRRLEWDDGPPPKFLHVAGTNGKGSVTAMLESILLAAGFSVGAYFSPYVYEFRERIKKDGCLISERDVARFTSGMAPIGDALAETRFGGPTEFEFKTAMGLLYWTEPPRPEFVALETGLGGRLDATNVVRPIVCVITEIGLDHREHLGDSISEIAAEKAGIIKPGIPVVSAATSEAASQVIADRAAELGSNLWQLGSEITVVAEDEGWRVTTPAAARAGLRSNLLGGFQARNAAAAIAALDIAGIQVSDEAIHKGLQTVSLPGRMEIYSEDPPIYLDGAHNRQALETIVAEVARRHSAGTIRVVYSAATGHDVAESLEALAGTAVYAAPMNHPRAASEAELPRPYASVCDAIRQALDDVVPGDALLITGSFYLLAEAKRCLESTTI